jgi:hypothetical protein
MSRCANCTVRPPKYRVTTDDGRVLLVCHYHKSGFENFGGAAKIEPLDKSYWMDWRRFPMHGRPLRKATRSNGRR